MDEFIFIEKYRPDNLGACVLPNRITALLRTYVDKGELQNLLFAGPPGTGKTTAAKAMCREMGAVVLMINGSEENGIDTLRTKIKRFASTMSLDGGQKVVILDEADQLTQAMQPALRGFMEEFSHNCKFILTCNYKHRLIGPLRDSRLAQVEFVFTADEKPDLMQRYFLVVSEILKTEKIEFEPMVLAQFVAKFFPDFRRTLNELQKYSQTGPIDSGILSVIGDAKVEELVQYLQDKNFTKMRKWVAENPTEPNILYESVYEILYEKIDGSSKPALTVLIGEYMKHVAFIANPELYNASFLTEVMGEVTFK